MTDPAISDLRSDQPPVLSSGERRTGVRDARPVPGANGVLDAKTFDAIEADQLFDSLNHAVTHAGQSILYRSLARPGTDPEVARKKQEALRELERAGK